MAFPFGIDISKYQDPSAIDYDKITEQVDFVILRIGFGWAKDIYFERHYLAFTERGVRIGVYHFPLNTRLQEQADLVKQALDGKRIEVGLWVDVEATYQSRSEINAYIPILENTVDTEIGIYTSYWKWLEVMQNETRWASKRLWVANYGVTVPSLPSPWKKWCLWQYSSTGRLNGYAGNLDLDLANAECLSSIPAIGAELPEPPPEPPTEDKLFDAKVYSWATPYINLRSEPRVAKETDIGDVYPNTVVSVYEVLDGWYRTGNGFVMSQYLERLDFTPPATIIDIAPLWQKDPRWKDVKLGNSNLTLGSDGCLVTCFAMAFGLLPDVFNARMKEVGGFTGARIYWAMVKKAYPDTNYLKAIDCYYVPAPLNEIDALLDQGIPVMVHVTRNGYQHWVTIIGKNGNDYIINDPIDGVRCSFFERYKDPARWILRIRAYRRI